jgi:23S rRNA pseudouridine2605 synthase
VPPRFAYWTILVGGLPTAFRAAERAELLPTFKRLQEKHPDAVMQWFSRGKLWESPEAAREALIRQRMEERPRDRGRDWRPGGEHRDPRQKYIDAKKARNQDRRKERFERRQEGKGPARPDRPPRPEGPAGWKDRPRGPKPEGRREWRDRPSGPKPEGRREWNERPRGPRPPGKPSGSRPSGPRPSGPRPPGSRPSGPRSGPRPPRGPRGPKR